MVADGPSTAKCTRVASDSATLSRAGTLFYLLACATHAVAAAAPSPPPGFVFAGSRELTDTALNSTANADLPLAKRAGSGEDALWGCAERTACPLNSTIGAARSVGEHHSWRPTIGWANDHLDFWLYHTFFCDRCARPRVFVELGALDGVSASNTMYFQRNLEWHGVLIEGMPANAAQLIKNRNAAAAFSGSIPNIIIPEAVCPTAGSVVYSGTYGTGSAGILEHMEPRFAKHFRNRLAHNTTVPCRPLREMLALARLDAIDLFSLDVEGAELMVLQTMDWQVPVRVFVIENDVSPPKFDAVRRLLADHGYAPYNPSGVDGTGEQVSKGHLQKCVGSKKRPTDEVFVHRSLLPGLASRVARCRQCAPSISNTGVEKQLQRWRACANASDVASGGDAS